MAAGLPAPASLGQIRSARGYLYLVTPEDLLWLARAVQFEGGDHTSTIWAYAQRAVKYGVRSLSDLVRAHSQTLNPMWDDPSDPKCITRPQDCTPAQIERRRRARETPWDQLDTTVRAKVIAWARAELGNPVPRAVDFASYALESYLRSHPGARLVKQVGRQWYVTEPDTTAWPVDFVTMHYGGRVSGALAGGGFWRGALIGAGIGGLLGLGIWVYRSST